MGNDTEERKHGHKQIENYITTLLYDPQAAQAHYMNADVTSCQRSCNELGPPVYDHIQSQQSQQSLLLAIRSQMIFFKDSTSLA